MRSVLIRQFQTTKTYQRAFDAWYVKHLPATAGAGFASFERSNEFEQAFTDWCLRIGATETTR